MSVQNFLNNSGVLFLDKPPVNLKRIYDNTLIQTQNSEEKVKLLLIRDLLHLNWSITKSRNELRISPPSFYNKEIIKKSMSISRQRL